MTRCNVFRTEQAADQIDLGSRISSAAGSLNKHTGRRGSTGGTVISQPVLQPSNQAYNSKLETLDWSAH